MKGTEFWQNLPNVSQKASTTSLEKDKVLQQIVVNCEYTKPRAAKDTEDTVVVKDEEAHKNSRKKHAQFSRIIKIF
jgi:hypothetical protein